jgi:C1A family cysteine protease
MKISALYRSPIDPRDYKFSSTLTTLPASVDLMPEVEEIENQRDAGSCTAHATTSAVEVLDNRRYYRDKLAPQFNYDVTRAYEERLDQPGANLRNAIKMGMHFGFCLESEYPYTNAEKTGTPPPECYVSAAKRKITLYEGVELPTVQNGLSYWHGVDNLKKALAEGLPVVIAMHVYEPIFSITGPLKDQVYIPYNTKYVGNHAVTLIGYDDSYSGFIYANSWGKEWGDGGFGRLPYQSFGEIFEAWVIRGYRDILIQEPVPEPEPVPVPPVPPAPEPIPEPPKPEPQPEPVPPAPQQEDKDNSLPMVIGALIVLGIVTKVGGLW